MGDAVVVSVVEYTKEKHYTSRTKWLFTKARNSNIPRLTKHNINIDLTILQK